MRIAITGANGQLGRLVVAAVRRRLPEAEVVALVRTPAKAADLGVTVREADYDKPATLTAALEGVDRVLLISGSEIGKRIEQHRALITAAVQAGVKQLAYTSLLHADTSPLSLADEHRQTEALLRASGLPWTILRNGWYTENYTMSLGGALAAGAMIGSAGEGRIASAARADYAEAAAVVLTEAGHLGKTYELAGDNAYTLADMAAAVSVSAGKTIPYVNLPVAEYAKTLLGFGLPPVFAEGLASWDDHASRGALFHDGNDLSRLIKRPTTPMPVTVAAAIAALG